MTIAVVPIGVLTAIYLQKYTRPDSRVTRLIRLVINNLAGCVSRDYDENFRLGMVGFVAAFQ